MLAIKAYDIFCFLFPRTEMDVFGNFDHFISNIVQNVKFLR